MTNQENQFFDDDFYRKLEITFKNAAWDAAGKIVENLKSSVYANSAGCWPDDHASRVAADTFWSNTRSAHAKRIMSDVSADIKTYINTRIAEEITKCQ